MRNPQFEEIQHVCAFYDVFESGDSLQTDALFGEFWGARPLRKTHPADRTAATIGALGDSSPRFWCGSSMYFFNEIEARYCPVYINGLVHERFIKDGHKVAMSYPWCRPAPVMQGWQPAPPELWLISQDKRYEFDCRAGYGGFVVSSELFGALREHASGWHVSRLHVVNGRNEPISDKQYVFIQPGMTLSLADPINRATAVYAMDDFQGIVEISRLEFNAAARARKVFVCLGEPILWPFIFLGVELGAALAGRTWSGVEILPIASFSRDLRF